MLLADMSRSVSVPPILALSRYTTSPTPLPADCTPVIPLPEPETCVPLNPPPEEARALVNQFGRSRCTMSYASRNVPASISAVVISSEFVFVFAAPPAPLAPAVAHARRRTDPQASAAFRYRIVPPRKRNGFDSVPGDQKPPAIHITGGFALPASNRETVKAAADSCRSPGRRRVSQRRLLCSQLRTAGRCRQ